MGNPTHLTFLDIMLNTLLMTPYGILNEPKSCHELGIPNLF